MDKLLIRGGRQLLGEVQISGAKNAALPELCACLLTAEPVTLRNVPRLQDVNTMLKLIRNMGVGAVREEDGRVLVTAGTLTRRPLTNWSRPCAPRCWRWGPCWRALARPRCPCPAAVPSVRARWTSTSRALQAMGAEITVEHGYMIAKLPKGRTRLKGARIATDMVTVTGTENFLMAARSGRRRNHSGKRRPGARDP
jgi:UDP-N-acetylglucosamine 1-carboxyvinyltransferase